MTVIPAINCPDFECVKKHLSIVEGQLPDSEWLHIDITDGKFTLVKTWNKPEELSKVIGQLSNVNLEIHLMVERPEEVVESWLKTGAKRIIIHLEAIRGRNGANKKLNFIIEKCSEYGVELMMALNPETPAEEIFPYLDSLFCVQFLAVKPGFSGQKFNESILEKIKILRERVPDITIEIDGGIDFETAKAVKEAGADIVVSSSYIFGGKDPQAIFKQLSAI